MEKNSQRAPVFGKKEEVKMLPKERSKKQTDPRQMHVYLYGQPKIGKSTFVAGLFNGNVLFLDTEKGTRNLEVMRTPIKTWADFMATVKELHGTDHGFQCVAVDTVDSLRDLCIQHILEKNRWPDVAHPKFSEYGRGWGLLHQEFSKGIKSVSYTHLTLPTTPYV